MGSETVPDSGARNVISFPMAHPPRFYAQSFLLVLFFLSSSVFAAENRVKVEVFQEQFAYRSGCPLRVAFQFRIPVGHRMFWTHPGTGDGRSVSVEWSLPDGWKSEGMQFPAPSRFPIGSGVVFGYAGDVVFMDTLVPPMGEPIGAANLHAKLTWEVAQEETIMEETQKTITLYPADRSVVKPLFADKFRIWQGRIPKLARNLQAKLEKKLLAKNYTLIFAGTKGQARPELFPAPNIPLDLSQPLKGRYSDGHWNVELPFLSENAVRAKILTGVLEPGPTGGAPVSINVHFP
jgi:DsbC/DsbD-like thiol-disulfide interchange protein